MQITLRALRVRLVIPPEFRGRSVQLEYQFLNHLFEFDWSVRELDEFANPAGTMIYVDDNVTVTGPWDAIENNCMVTLTANGNITQTGNLLYATEPVTTTQNQAVNSTCCNGDPVDTLIPAYQNMNQVLGIFTANGQFQLQAPSNNANMETDASIAMISASPTGSNGKFATVGSYGVGTWTNIGGRAENSINGVSINTSNVYFDRRFTTRNNFWPPWCFRKLPSPSKKLLPPTVPRSPSHRSASSG